MKKLRLLNLNDSKNFIEELNSEKSKSIIGGCKRFPDSLPFPQPCPIPSPGTPGHLILWR